eukprot:7384766-Prymnesium_polylepis.1
MSLAVSTKPISLFLKLSIENSVHKSDEGFLSSLVVTAFPIALSALLGRPAPPPPLLPPGHSRWSPPSSAVPCAARSGSSCCEG